MTLLCSWRTVPTVETGSERRSSPRQPTKQEQPDPQGPGLPPKVGCVPLILTQRLHSKTLCDNTHRILTTKKMKENELLFLCLQGGHAVGD